MNPVGFDLDGTITEEWWNSWSSKAYTRGEGSLLTRTMIKMKLARIKPAIIPIDYVHIITVRPEWLVKGTIRWLNKNGVKFFALHTPRGQHTLQGIERSTFKAEAINSLALGEYYEDELDLREALEGLCPDTEILPPEEAIRRGRARQV